METTVIISLVLIFISGVIDAHMDKLKVWNNSVWKNLSKDNWFYKWAGPGDSWKNKWKLDDKGKLIPQKNRPWYYLQIYKPEHQERFPYSSTFLVFTTDAWHFFQSLWWFSVTGALAIQLPGLHWLLWLVILTVLRMVSFTLFYDHFLKKPY